MADPFRSAAPPPRLRRTRFADQRWLTWSDDARAFLVRLRSLSRGLPAPTLAHDGPGDVCFRLAPRDLPPAARRALSGLAAGFAAFTLPGPARMVLLRDMLDDRIDGRTVHVALSLLCAVLRDQARYAPIAAAPAARSAFPLHCDLFRSPLLLTVLDAVPSDGSGACLFGRVSTVLSAIGRRRLLPAAVRRTLPRMLVVRDRADRYDELFDVLHGMHDWGPALHAVLRTHQRVLPLRRGEGYLLDDRCWLHGREAQSSTVRPARLFRLAFAGVPERAGVARALVAAYRQALAIGTPA